MSFNYIEGVEPVTLKDKFFYDGIYTEDQKDVIKNKAVFNLATDMILMASKVEGILRIGYCSDELDGNLTHTIHLVNRYGMAVVSITMKDEKYKIATKHMHLRQRGKDRFMIESTKASFLIKKFKVDNYGLLRKLITASYENIYKEIKSANAFFLSAFKTSPDYGYATGELYFTALKLAFSDDKQYAVTTKELEDCKKSFQAFLVKEKAAAAQQAEVNESLADGMWIIGYEPHYKRMIVGGGKIKDKTIEYDIPLRLCNADFTNLSLEEPLSSNLLFSLALCKSNREKLPVATWDATNLIPRDDHVFKETASASHSTNGKVTKYNPQWFLVAR
jgi:hypothetical protein